MSISEKVSIWVYIAMDAAIVGAFVWYVALKAGAVIRSRGMLKRDFADHAGKRPEIAEHSADSSSSG